MSCTATPLRSRSLNIVSLSDMIEGSCRSWDLYTTGQLVDSLKQKKENRFSLNGNGIMSPFLGLQCYRSTLYMFVPAVLSKSCSSWKGYQMEGKWSYCCCFGGTTSGICPKQHRAYLCRTYLTFSPSVSLKSTWCNHAIVRKHLQLRRIAVLF